MAEEYVSLDDDTSSDANVGNDPKSKTNNKSAKGKKVTPAEQQRLDLQQAIEDAESKRVDALDLEEEAEKQREELEEQIRVTKKRLEEFEVEQQRQAELKRSLSTNAASGAVAGVSATVAALGSLVVARSFLEKRRSKIEEERQRLQDELKKKEEELSKTTTANKRTYSLVVSTVQRISASRRFNGSATVCGEVSLEFESQATVIVLIVSSFIIPFYFVVGGCHW
jgi:chromosome segregation ATPase